MNKELHIHNVPEDANLHGGQMQTDHIPPFVTPQPEGKKLDADKPRLDLIPPLALDEVARVLMFGAKKYDSWNWAKGMDWHRNIAAAQRHIKKFSMGEDVDPETGICHMAHAATDTLFSLEYYLRGIGRDDRYKWGK